MYHFLVFVVLSLELYMHLQQKALDTFSGQKAQKSGYIDIAINFVFFNYTGRKATCETCTGYFML